MFQAKASERERDHTIGINDEDDLFKEIHNLKELREKEPNLVSESMTAKDFATADDAVITTSSTLTDEKILQEATQTENDEVEEIKDDDKELVATSMYKRCRKLTGNIEKPFSIWRKKR